jgi:hypothetical protein
MNIIINSHKSGVKNGEIILKLWKGKNNETKKGSLLGKTLRENTKSHLDGPNLGSMSAC